jgi:hypothetical protein
MRNCIVVFLFVVLTSNPGHAQKVNEKDVPTVIVSLVKSKNNGQHVTMWVRDKNRGKYIATVLNDTAPLVIEVNMKGEWLATNHLMLEAGFPPAVLKTLKETYLNKGYDASNFVFVEEPGQSYYRVDVSSEDEDVDIKLDVNGKILAKEAR